MQVSMEIEEQNQQSGILEQDKKEFLRELRDSWLQTLLAGQLIWQLRIHPLIL